MKKTILVALLLSLTLATTAQVPDIATLTQQAKLLEAENRYTEAAQIYEALMQSAQAKATPDELTFYVWTGTFAASDYKKAKNYGRAYELSGLVLKEGLKDNSRDLIAYIYSASGYELCTELMGQGQYEQARLMAESVLPYATEDGYLSLLRKRIALSWTREGNEAFRVGRFDHARDCFEHTQQCYADMGMTEDVIKQVCNVALCTYYLSQIESAISLYEQAYAQAEAAGLTDQMIEARRGQKEIFASLGDRRRLVGTIQSLQQIGANEADNMTPTRYALLAEDAVETGDYATAEDYYLKAIGLSAMQSRRDTIDVALLYGKLRQVAREAGRYDEALDYENRRAQLIAAVRIADEGTHFSQLSYLYHYKGNEQLALQYADSLVAASLNDKRNAQRMAIAYQTRGIMLADYGRAAEGIADIERAEAALGDDAELYQEQRMALLSIKSGMQSRVEQYEASEQGYRRYYEWVCQVKGENNVDACNALVYLSNAEAFNGHTEQGKQHYADAAKRLCRLVKDNLSYVSGQERQAYWESVSDALWAMTGYGLKAEATADEFCEAAYDALLFSKSLLLSAEASAYEALQRYGSTRDQADYATIAALQTRIKALSAKPTENRDEISRLIAERMDLGHALTLRSAAYRDYTAFLDIHFADIRKALGPMDVVVDFADYVRPNGERRYAAYVYRADTEHPLLLSDFGSTELDSLMDGRRLQAMYRPELSARLVDLVWGPLKPHVADSARVYYVPAGVLHQVAIESLVTADGSLLGDHYDFVRLSSAREILTYSENMADADNRRAVLFGGLQYDVDDVTMAAESRKSTIEPLLAQTDEATRSAGSAQEGFAPLAHSADEVRRVADILVAGGVDTRLLTGTSGTEEAFLALSGHAPQTLLFSTHGFYYTAAKADRVDYLRGYTDAMALTGLILSGGNRAWRGETLPEGVQSGVLTADKIALTDLSATDLSVLSACQTGQGETTSEGVYGLQRAFKKAGVQTMIMTLWEVNDNSTRDFMVAFFEQLSTNGWNKRKAFEAAKRLVRQRYRNPQNWAPFVMLD